MVKTVLRVTFFLGWMLVLGSAVAQDNPKVKLMTNRGEVVIELFAVKAPKSVENFLAYVSAGFYDGTIFHRVIKDFMVQGGGFEEGMVKKQPREPIANESDNKLSNQRGTIAMARTNNPHSATSQFFVNVVDNDFLDYGARGDNQWGYAVFGKVVEGMDVVDAMVGTATTTVGPYRDVPASAIVIESVQLESNKE